MRSHRLKEHGSSDFIRYIVWYRHQLIYRYIAREYGLYGANNLEAAKIDMICEVLQDLRTALPDCKIVFDRDSALPNRRIKP